MVVDDPGTALRLVGSGRHVVVVVAEDAPPLRPSGPGRLAVMIGEPADARVSAAAAEMDRELFGGGVVTFPPEPAPA